MLGRIWTLLALRRPISLLWRLLKDGRVPLQAKWPIPLAVLFILSPVGLRLALIPLLGELAIPLLLLLASLLFLRLCPGGLVREHLETMAGRPPKPPRPPGDVIDGDYEILE